MNNYTVKITKTLTKVKLFFLTKKLEHTRKKLNDLCISQETIDINIVIVISKEFDFLHSKHIELKRKLSLLGDNNSYF